MKSLILFVIYITTFVTMYLLLSAVGLILTEFPYKTILHDFNWFMLYSTTLGWWIAAFPTREYYVSNEEYFDTVFH